MLIKEYINPWHRSKIKESRATYKTNEQTEQEEYKGYYIVQGVNPWVDVVENVDDSWCCVTQRGSVKNAKKFIDSLKEAKDSFKNLLEKA